MRPIALFVNLDVLHKDIRKKESASGKKNNTLTFTVFLLNRLQLLQMFQHSSQIGDSIFKCNFLIFTWVGIFQQLPNLVLIDYLCLFLRPDTHTYTHRVM